MSGWSDWRFDAPCPACGDDLNYDMLLAMDASESGEAHCRCGVRVEVEVESVPEFRVRLPEEGAGA